MSANTSARHAPEKSPIRVDSFKIKLPESGTNYDQDAEFCILEVNGEQRELRFHDYHEIYDIPGLYERLFYEVLECNSPKVVCGLLGKELEETGVTADALRILDLGAGNGIVAEELHAIGIPYVVGADIIPEASAAAERDRPEAYADYHVVDIAKLSAEEHA
ncbi:MAG: class I SAM-dependent methyltransferase, partial [Sciscionella sp.]